MNNPKNCMNLPLFLSRIWFGEKHSPFFYFFIVVSNIFRKQKQMKYFLVFWIRNNCPLNYLKRKLEYIITQDILKSQVNTGNKFKSCETWVFYFLHMCFLFSQHPNNVSNLIGFFFWARILLMHARHVFWKRPSHVSWRVFWTHVLEISSRGQSFLEDVFRTHMFRKVSADTFLELGFGLALSLGRLRNCSVHLIVLCRDSNLLTEKEQSRKCCICEMRLVQSSDN